MTRTEETIQVIDGVRRRVVREVLPGGYKKVVSSERVPHPVQRQLTEVEYDDLF